MVPKSGSQLPDSRFVLSDSDFAMHIGLALLEELGATRRATKTVMRWTGVSDRTARSWLHGRASPSGSHLIALAAHSPSVMAVLLRLTGNSKLEVVLGLREIEAGLVRTLTQVRAMLGKE